MLMVHWTNTMTTWSQKLRLKGMAEEDIYFARRDRELIDALRKQRSKGLQPQTKHQKVSAGE